MKKSHSKIEIFLAFQILTETNPKVLLSLLEAFIKTNSFHLK